MMTPCKKLYYAVEAVLYIAYYSHEHPVSSRDIARQQGLPPRHLEQIMQKLVHGRILRGMRGPKGGYQLAKPSDQISIGEICEMINEDDMISDLPPTTELGEEVIRPFWELLHAGVKDRLYVITIADLCDQAVKKNIRNKAPQKLDSMA
ncbi:MAG: Rrf2 family transcriptional regulator [Alphaproteobacteria bacterium]|nr:Rrf2 family transcriptional regulator [Alphaproteobacteria bacterium]